MYYNNRKLALNFFWVILGVLLVVLSIAEILDPSAAGRVSEGRPSPTIR